MTSDLKTDRNEDSIRIAGCTPVLNSGLSNEQAAVRAVLRDLARGSRVPKAHWFNLLGSEAEAIEKVAATYPDMHDVPLEDAGLIIHNVLNLYVNGLSISPAEWEEIGTHSKEVADAFSS